MSLRNVTITLDEATARWARVEAARREMSLSRFIGSMLSHQMAAERGYEKAMAAYLSRSPRKLKKASGRYPTRDEVHDRAGLR